MLITIQRIVQEVNRAPDLDSALALIVKRVKAALRADVCSIYLGTADGAEQVLRATDGLDPAAVGRVRLKRHEGLVGLVVERAEPVSLADAVNHPRYCFVAETGEVRFHGFAGAPIIQHRRVLGVLVARWMENRQPTESQLTLLVTLSAQLAGAIAVAEAGEGMEASGAGPAVARPLQGRPGAPGIALGTAVVFHPPARLSLVPDRPAEDPAAEEARFRAAVADELAHLKEVERRLAASVPPEERALFDAYALLLGGDALVDGTVAHIHAGLWAPAGLRRTIEEHAAVFDAMEDEYLQERASDLRDLGRRLLARMEGGLDRRQDFPERTVLVGENLAASDLAEVPSDRLAGVVSGHGSAQSHVAILANAMGVPAVMGVADLPFGRLDGQTVVADGYRGRLLVSPSPPLLREFERLVREERELQESLGDLCDLPGETPDGVRIGLYINAGLLADIAPSLGSGAEGVGLYRTEIPFMMRESLPGEQTQRDIYRQVLESFAPRPVVIRTLDIGGDKMLPYLAIHEENPFLGWRGIRVTLDHPEIFLTQVRALLRAAAGLDNLRILLPMISSAAEVDESRLLVRRAYQELREEGEAVNLPQVGVMVEVPSAVFQADVLAARADFLSIGTNDLTQYILAVDRNNASVAELYDALHPAVLQAIRRVVEAGRAHGRPVSVCGELAGDPMGALVLLGLGVDSLSMNSGSLPRVKKVIRSFSAREAAGLADEVLAFDHPVGVRNRLFRAVEERGLGGLVRAGK